MICASH